ncbi:unnamed protein product [Allacma fusca]|uniref:Uncharacterized protein n=1 Tax=Allacma fusca TaxID=39272 RepID=A0A8J2KWF0_9HEXA|nr:unnamed protein product [Allacma fusca]
MFSAIEVLHFLVNLSVWIRDTVVGGYTLLAKACELGSSVLQLICIGPVQLLQQSRVLHYWSRTRGELFQSVMPSPSRSSIRRKRDQRLISQGESHDSLQKGLYSFRPFVFKELSPVYSDGINKGKEPKPRSGHRIVCDEGNFYSFGGYLEITVPFNNFENAQGIQHLFEELWKFNVSTQHWEYLPTEGETPKELASHSAVMHGDYMVVFGGTGVPFGTSSSNKMSICDLRTLKWQRVHTTGTPPSPQYGQAIVLDKKCFYVIGGTTGYDYSLDVHKLDLVTFEWETLFVTRGEAREPTPRYRHEVAFDGSQIFILGGGTASRAYDLTAVPTFDVKTREWNSVNTIGDPIGKRRFPPARKCQGAVQRGNDVFICGGYNSRYIFTDLWKLNLSTLQWTRMPVKLPIPVYFHSTALTPAGCMLMFGGVTNVKSNTRTNKVFKIWLTTPSLKEMCWEAVLHYQPDLKFKSRQAVLEDGIPKDLVDRIFPSNVNRELPAPPL